MQVTLRTDFPSAEEKVTKSVSDQDGRDDGDEKRHAGKEADPVARGEQMREAVPKVDLRAVKVAKEAAK